ncbi:hypothetical protein PanWU01x14_035610, partial [Parasponia andersonii]
MLLVLCSSEIGPSVDPSPVKGGAAGHKVRPKAPAGWHLVVLSGDEVPAVPRSDAGGCEETLLSLAGESAAPTSSILDSGSKSSAICLGGEIAKLSGGAPRLKSRLSSPPPVPTKRRHEVGSSNEEEGWAEKRGRVAPSSDSDDDG